MARVPFPQSERILAMTIGYKHEETIAEQVFPVVPVDEEKFIWHEVSLKDSLQMPDTKVGRKSYPNEMEVGETERTAKTEDHAIDDFVPNSDLDKARPGRNPRTRAAAAVMKVVKLRQELRVRNIVFGRDNYLSAQTADLTATQFSDPEVNPINIIDPAREAMLIQPNQVTIGYDVYSALRRNPFVVKAVYKNSGDSGIVPLVALEDLFEMKFIVGKAAFDIAAKGQPADVRKMWRNHMAMQYIDPTVNADEASFTHGFIAHFDDVGAEIPDMKRGIKGGVTIRAGHQRTEIVASNLGAYLFENVV